MTPPCERCRRPLHTDTSIGECYGGADNVECLTLALAAAESESLSLRARIGEVERERDEAIKAGLILHGVEMVADGIVNRPKFGEGIAVAIAAGFRQFLDEHKAINYVETRLIDPASTEEYVVTIVRPNGKTPNERRLEAEAERDAAEKRAVQAGEDANGWMRTATEVAEQRDASARDLAAARARISDLESALSWVAGNYRHTLAGHPVRDADECLERARTLALAALTPGAAHD